MNQVVLQVPVSKSLKERAETVARDQGVSLTETIRKLLAQFARRELRIETETDEYITLSPRAKKRYAKAIREIKQGIGVTKTKNVDELLELLRK